MATTSRLVAASASACRSAPWLTQQFAAGTRSTEVELGGVLRLEPIFFKMRPCEAGRVRVDEDETHTGVRRVGLGVGFARDYEEVAQVALERTSCPLST